MSVEDGCRNAREQPGTWHFLSEMRPGPGTRERLTRDGYRIKVYGGMWWVSYVGHPESVEVNTQLL